MATQLILAQTGDEIWGMSQSALIFTILFGVATLVLGIFGGLLVSRHYFAKGKRERQPVWYNWTAPLVTTYTTNNPSLAVTYASVPIKNAAISWVAFWNHGAETIRQSDLVLSDPFRVVAASGELVLDAKCVAQNNPHSLISISNNPGGRDAVITFDHLAQGQGAVFQITHTGTSPAAIEMQGSMKDSSLLRRADLDSQRPRGVPRIARGPEVSKRMDRITSRAIIGTVILPIVIGSFFLTWVMNRDVGGAAKLAIVVLAIAIVLTPTVYFLFLGHRVTARFETSLPSGLDAFEDDGESSRDYWDQPWPPRAVLF